MASKETFAQLALSFRQGIAKLNVSITQAEVSVQAIKLQLASEEQRLKQLKAEKAEHVSQLKGIRTIIHQMEDAEIQHHRNIEDDDIV